MLRIGVQSLASAIGAGAIVAGCASASSPHIEHAKSNAATDLTTSRGLDAPGYVRRTNLEPEQAEGFVPRGELEMDVYRTGRNVPRYQATLTNWGAFTEEHRGIVIMLPGSILFAPSQTELLPEGRARLDDVVAVLLATRERHVTINGYAVPQNADPQNFELSRRRANVVRDYITERNYQPNLVQAHRTSEEHASADFENTDRRADERRIEIIISADERALKP